MKKLFQISIFLLLAVAVIAQEPAPQKMEQTLRVYEWKDLSAHFPNSQIISMDEISVLKIENANKTPLEVLLLTVTNSALLQKANRISWEMKFENVLPSTNVQNGISAPQSEYGIVIPPRNFQNRSGAQCGLLEKYPPRASAGDCWTNSMVEYFVGTKNWDKYDSYISAARYDNQTHPNEVALKLFLPSSGTVYLRPIKLFGMVNRLNSWWSAQQSGLIGGIGGSIIGCFGGLIGWLVSKGKARKFVLSATTSSIVLGILLTIAGLVAAILQQPYSVWYALLLPGVILVLVFSLNLHSIQRRYDELEIRRMTSIDATGG